MNARDQSPIVIALTNQKGGCGKTTTAVSLAAGLARAGHRVAIVDIDPQCNATDSFGLNREQLLSQGCFSIADAYLANRSISEIVVGFDDRFDSKLYVAAGHRGLSTVPQRLESELQLSLARGDVAELDADEIRNEHRHRLRTAIKDAGEYLEYVLIDTPPDLGFLMTTALIAADHFIIPVFPSGYDLKGLETLMKTVERVQSKLNSSLRLLGVVLGNVDATARLDSDIQQMLRTKFGQERLFKTVIGRSVKHREAPVYGKTIFEHSPNQQAANQFADLTTEVLERLTQSSAARKARNA